MPDLLPWIVPAGTLNSAPQPVLTSENGLVLRPWTAADAPMLMDAFSDPATQHWHGRTVDSIAEAERVIDEYAHGWRTETDANWAVADAGGEVLGRVALRNLKLMFGEAETAYWMRAAARGRGAAPAAVRTLSSWGFGIGLHRLILFHSVENLPSCRVAQKAGYALEGLLRSAHPHRDGWHDLHLHALINPHDQPTTSPAAR